MVDLPGSDSEIQFEENTCLKVAGNLTLTAGSPLGDDDSEVQIKKVEEGVSPCNDQFNIKAGGNIVMAAHGEGDGEVQIEENNKVYAGGNTVLTADEIEIKENVLLQSGGNIIIATNDFDIKPGAQLVAGGTVTIVPLPPQACF